MEMEIGIRDGLCVGSFGSASAIVRGCWGWLRMRYHLHLTLKAAWGRKGGCDDDDDDEVR